MDFYNVIENRTSVKDFTNTPVNKEKLSRMINAAMRAPSWKNNTSYKMILVNNKNEKDRLSETIMNDTDSAKNALKSAPMAMIVVADPSESGIMADREYYLVDSAVAMEHFVLAATNEGYGTCWIGALDEDRVRDILNIPKEYRVVAMTPIGEIQQTPTHHHKKDVTEHVFLNNWGSSYTLND
ncbi:nitroreductase family protein [Dethiothermospora halolimnae]|uniref:nitroreductase family protein n=1 Tax=Dethiothermospora halolimnae TaxID=3114390 RepID=UPI003CCC40D5